MQVLATWRVRGRAERGGARLSPPAKLSLFPVQLSTPEQGRRLGQVHELVVLMAEAEGGAGQRRRCTGEEKRGRVGSVCRVRARSAATRSAQHIARLSAERSGVGLSHGRRGGVRGQHKPVA